jgi:Aspartyl protease
LIAINNPTKMLSRKTWAIVAIAAFAVGFNTAFAQEHGDGQEPEFERFRYDREQFIGVPVVIYGQERLFVLDTGSTETFVEKSHQNKLGTLISRGSVDTATTTIMTSIFKAPDVKIGWRNPRSIVGLNTVRTADLHSITEVYGVDVAGVIGMDVLNRHVIRLNPDDGYCELMNVHHSQPAQHVERLVFEKTKPKSPCVRMRISDRGFIRCWLIRGVIQA